MLLSNLITNTNQSQRLLGRYLRTGSQALTQAVMHSFCLKLETILLIWQFYSPGFRSIKQETCSARRHYFCMRFSLGNRQASRAPVERNMNVAAFTVDSRFMVTAMQAANQMGCHTVIKFPATYLYPSPLQFFQNALCCRYALAFSSCRQWQQKLPQEPKYQRPAAHRRPSSDPYGDRQPAALPGHGENPSR